MASKHDYRTVLDQLKPLLPEYLRGHGREPDASGKIQCINPEHKDKHPSCSIFGDKRDRFHCFSCGSSGDIFSAAHLLDGRPLTGKEFITENVIPLADKFNIPHEGLEISEDMREKSEIFRVYELVAAILTFSPDETVAQKVYGWSLKAIREIDPQIGTLDWQTFATRMRELGGYTQVYLESVCGITPSLIDVHNLTFAIRNPRGIVVGFAARDARYGTSPRIQKWRNTSNDVKIFEKGRILYGLDTAKDTSGPLILVEGYADVLELRLKGLHRVAAYLGSGLTEQQAQVLQTAGRLDLILCPDRDDNEAGEKGIMRTLDKVLPNFPELRVRIKDLPKTAGGVDPADYVRAHGLEKFLGLPDSDAFGWRLDRFPAETPSEEICALVMPIIFEEPNPIRQERMLKSLAERTEVRLVTLQRTLDQHIDKQKEVATRQIRKEVDSLRSRISSTPIEAIPLLLRQTAKSIEEVNRTQFSASLHGREETENYVNQLQMDYEKRGDKLPGWITGFEAIDTAFGGIPAREAMICIAADGNVGKSSLCQNLAMQIALRNSDVTVLLYTIDDTRSQTIPRLISQLTGVEINAICQPKRYKLTDEQLDNIQKAWGSLREMIQTGRLDIKDAAQGNTLDFARQWIESTKAHTSRPVLFILDNFHCLSGLPGTEEREKLEAASAQVKEFCKVLGVTALCTMELRKREDIRKRPRMEDLKGSKRFEYDSSVVIMMHSPLHADPGDADVDCWSEDGIRKPILQLWVDKNKISSFKGCLNMKFRPETSQMISLSGGGGLKAPELALDA
jgi:DNA primase